MNEQETAVDYTQATPGYVLDVIRDVDRVQCQLGVLASHEVQLEFRTTIEQWREAFDLLECPDMGRGLNQWWELGCSDAEWWQVLEPAAQRTLCDVCEFIASRVSMPVLRPGLSQGERSNAVLAELRRLLVQYGADLGDVVASAAVGEYARMSLSAFVLAVTRLAPGALPEAMLREKGGGLWVLCAMYVLISIPVLAFVMGMAYWKPALWWLVAVLIAGLCSAVAVILRGKERPPDVVRFGELVSLQDLAMVMAERLECRR